MSKLYHCVLCESLLFTIIKFIFISGIFLLISCNRQPQPQVSFRYLDSFKKPEIKLDVDDYFNSVKGHIEQDTIIGNFTGERSDTIYVYREELEPDPNDSIQLYSIEYFNKYEHFYARSNNPNIPDVEIFGAPGTPPLLVFEGDLDGDGKDEWGYLPIWMNSQWRQYRVYNYDSLKKEWRHLYYDLPDTSTLRAGFLHTPEYVRASGWELIERGPEPGLIKIHYGEYDGVVYDTIIKPNYIPITDKTY